MNLLGKQILIWTRDYFPFIPRLFGLKILTYGYVDITPDLCSGSCPKERKLESKVSWLIKNYSSSPLSIKIVIACVQENDGWVQAYLVDETLQGGWHRDISCGEEKFDHGSKQKHKKTLVPIAGFVKIDHFASQDPHPSCISSQAFQIIADDKDVVVLKRNFLNRKRDKVFKWIVRCVLGLLIAIVLLGYFWVQYVDRVWKYFFH